MTDIHQIIIQNSPDKGLDVVASTLEKSQIVDIIQFVPKEIPIEFNQVFLTKFHHSSGKVALVFTFDDGVDHFGRRSIKTHTFLVKTSLYNEKTIQYFISPLVNGSMNLEENNILKSDDFEILSPYPVSSKLTELVFIKKHVHVSSQKTVDPVDLIQIFATIDRLIPPPLITHFSFQTMAPSNKKKDLKEKSLVYIPHKLSDTHLLEELQKESSEFLTIQALNDSLSSLSSLRQLQKQLFIDLPEKRLNFKIYRRFGINTILKIRRTIESIDC
ncbi:MAG: hypothetical protein ACFE95_22620 [Candidatus Hodarchaeota archaeon]